MESTFRFRPCSHHRHLCHHHHHHHHPCCHHHHHHHRHRHHCNCHNLCPRISPLPLQYPLPNFDKEIPVSLAQVEEEPKQNELDKEDGEEEDDPIFVLTDEWREYFAKSEAKRKLEKQLAKKKDRRP